MLRLDPEQADHLRAAVASVRDLPKLTAALDALYAEFAVSAAERKPRCDASGRCCRFESFGHRLFITTGELASFVGRAPTGNPAWDGTGCVYQVDGLCGVHAVRPFGCRVFFCDPTAADWQQEMYERYHQRIAVLHDQFGVEYLYVEWREGLKAVFPSLPVKTARTVSLAVLR